MKIKLTYIISNIDKAIAFEWICETIDKNKFDLSFILMNNGNSYLEEYLIRNSFTVYTVKYKSKFDLISSFFKIGFFLKKNKTTIVHTHLFDATLSGLLAAKICGIKKRIYTRHYSTYHHLYFPNAVKWDKLNNLLSTHIVAISKLVKDVLLNVEHVSPDKIQIIYHGFKLNEFSHKNLDIIDGLKKKYNPSINRPVIGVISRFTELKGVQFIVPAFKKIIVNYPNALLLLFNSQGDFESKIDLLLNELPEKSYKKIVFEKNITSLYHLFDVFIHVPINSSIEAFGQTYIECMASGVPLIATKSGIANEILIDNNNAVIVDYENSEEIYKAMELLLKDLKLREHISENAKKVISEKFQLQVMVEHLESLYLL